MPFKDAEKRNAYFREWYTNHKAVHGRYVRRNAKERAVKIREFIAERKKSCLRCGEDHPACLVFHHRDPAEKEFDLSKAVSHRYSMERIEAEMAKCDVLCENCHRKLHWSLMRES